MQAVVLNKNFKNGFSIMEILVALGMLSIGILLVGALSQQVMNLSKSGKQIAALLELRNNTSQIIRNPTSWLQKMKGASGTYASCIDNSLTSFTCPTPNNNLLNGDTELQRLVGNMNVIDAPIVNAMGEKIAGTLNDPHYMDAEGRPCSDPALCALKSTGYFVRQSSAVSGNPGQIKFVMKIEKNPDASGNIASSLPMKTQYMSVDIGEDWKKTDTALECPSGTVKVGYLSSGTPQCIHPTLSCPSGQVQLGVDATQQPVCQSPPTTCAAGELVVLNPSTGSLACSAGSVCNQGIFAGFYAATGQVMCLANPSCSNGVQVGQNSDGSPKCANIPNCTTNAPHLTFNGIAFSCLSSSVAPVVATVCEDGSYVKGINANGGVICAPLRGIAGIDGQDGQSGQNGQDGRDAPTLTCRIEEKKSGSDGWNTVCCNNPNEVAVAGNTPQDPGDSAMRWNNKPSCMDVNKVGKGNQIQLRCCQVSASNQKYNISRSITAYTRQTQIPSEHIFDCGAPYNAAVKSIEYTSDMKSGFTPVKSGDSRIVFEHMSAHQNLKMSANVVVSCTPK